MSTPTPPQRRAGPITVAAAAVLALASGLIAHWEGSRTTAYADIVGMPTICYGHTGAEVRVGDKKTEEQCKQLLEGDMATAYAAVQRCITAPATDYQQAALTSAAFNIGPSVVCGSTLQRKANAWDWAGACAELDRWVFAGGKKVQGLINRRAAERRLCEGKGR